MRIVLRILAGLFVVAGLCWLVWALVTADTSLIPAPVFVALGGLFLTEGERTHSRKMEQSRFFLDSAVTGFEEARVLLADGNNSRVTWILAARVLARAESIAERVSDPAHLKVFEIRLDQYRRAFSEILGSYNADLNAGFFYGSQELTIGLDEAARQASAGGGLAMLDESSLYQIWKFAQFPERYADPLDRDSFPREKMVRLRATYPGLGAYLDHRDRYVSIGGKLIPNKKDG